MTNLKTIATSCLAISGLAMAQSPAATAPVAPRTGLYSVVTKGNIAADNTVDDYTRRPTLIGDRQYFAGFGGADMGNGAFSIKGMGWNWFGAVNGPFAAGGPDSLRFGLGDGNAWGAGLLLAVDRTSADVGGETTTYFETSGFGLFGDVALGHSDVYGSVSWSTGFPTSHVTGAALLPAPHNSVDAPAGEIVHHQLNLTAGWKHDATTEGTHSFNIEGSYLLAMHTSDVVTPNADDKVNILTIMPAWGYVLKANNDYSVFIGVNSTEILENNDVGAALSGTEYLLSFSPNLAFQKQLGHGFEGFAGGAVTAVYSATGDEPASGNSSSTLFTGGADVAVGLRWVKDNLAFEGSLKEAVLANGPYIIGGNAGQGLFFNIGLSLGI